MNPIEFASVTSRELKAGLAEPHRLGRNVFYRLSYDGEALLRPFGQAD